MRAGLAHEYVDAADDLERFRDRPAEAGARMLAAERFVVDGRRADADLQLEKALAFYRSVGATRYVREGEQLLAKSAWRLRRNASRLRPCGLQAAVVQPTE
jgi:hypothetical protein